MKREMLSGKIHTARITRCEVDYEGSLEIDPELLAEAGILPYEKILVANKSNGSRLETYAIPGKAGSREFCLNGPAAKCGNVGDIVTIFVPNGVGADRQEGLSIEVGDSKHFAVGSF